MCSLASQSITHPQGAAMAGWDWVMALNKDITTSLKAMAAWGYPTGRGVGGMLPGFLPHILGTVKVIPNWRHWEAFAPFKELTGESCPSPLPPMARAEWAYFKIRLRVQPIMPFFPQSSQSRFHVVWCLKGSLADTVGALPTSPQSLLLQPLPVPSPPTSTSISLSKWTEWCTRNKHTLLPAAPNQQVMRAGVYMPLLPPPWLEKYSHTDSP